MPKDNLLFKLDNLEYQYHYLNGTLNQFQPRLNSTSKIFNAKSKKTSKKISKLLADASLADVSQSLSELQMEIFNKKVYYLDGHIRSFLLKQMSQYRPTKKSKIDFTNIINSIKEQYGLENFVELVSKSKIIKLSILKLSPSRNKPPPGWFLSHPFWKIHEDKDQKFNPSRVWNEVVLKTKKADQLVSTLMNNEKCKELISGFNSGMDVFLAINRNRKTKAPLETAADPTDSEDSQDKDGQSDSDVGINNNQPEEAEQYDIDEELLQKYDGLLTASDEEREEKTEIFALDPNINYNEVTDEEPDEEESGTEEGEDILKKEKQRAALPELMAGYYSGGESDEESDLADDRVAREQISLTEKKKNRRGQRARRKIWEKKYGTQAKHIQNEVQKDMEDRKRRQQEYEERVVKRAAKHAALDIEEASLNKVYSKPQVPHLQAEHPSWVAKKKADEMQKNAKFEGKKIKFD